MKDEFCNIAAKVIEYLEPLMSKELLRKFPDNSAFDFDYSQSSIWSPLVTRAYNSVDLDLYSIITPQKLEFGFDSESNTRNNSVKKLTPGFKRKNNINVSFDIMKKKKKKTMKISEFSPTPIKNNCVPFTMTKGWGKVLKAASKKFKKKKKKDSTICAKICTYSLDSTQNNKVF